VASVNQVPPEILALIPDFWNKHYDGKDRDVIALTHVCRAWREVFISRSSLWTNLGCEDKDKTRLYLERSKSLPVNLSLWAGSNLPPHHPFFEVIPHSIGRLKSLSTRETLGRLEDITDHLSHPAPLLEELFIRGRHNPVLTSAFFNGDLSSLRELWLQSVCTDLPWRNMNNLTSFKLGNMSGGVSIKQLLDFFEGAPRLRIVDLFSATPASGAQNGRLVSLTRLERMEISGDGSAALLLDHLLIPVGARLTVEVDLPIKNHCPRFLDNLRNFPNFTDIHLHIDGYDTFMQFSGPNGQVGMIPSSPRVDKTRLLLESLDHFDTSKVERLKIHWGDSPSSDPPYRALLPMKRLRALTLHRCANPHIFIHALHPAMSSSGTVVCPELEELVIVLDNGTLDMKSVIGVVAARASRGAKLKSVRITGEDQPAPTDVLELEKHVSHVECGPEADGTDDYGVYSDEED
jgi:hypothetical protein